MIQLYIFASDLIATFHSFSSSSATAVGVFKIDKLCGFRAIQVSQPVRYDQLTEKLKKLWGCDLQVNYLSPSHDVSD